MPRKIGLAPSWRNFSGGRSRENTITALLMVEGDIVTRLKDGAMTEYYESLYGSQNHQGRHQEIFLDKVQLPVVGHEVQEILNQEIKKSQKMK